MKTKYEIGHKSYYHVPDGIEVLEFVVSKIIIEENSIIYENSNKLQRKEFNLGYTFDKVRDSIIQELARKMDIEIEKAKKNYEYLKNEILKLTEN